MMPCDGAIIFRDIVGNLDVLNIERDKRGRSGRAIISISGSSANAERL